MFNGFKKEWGPRTGALWSTQQGHLACLHAQGRLLRIRAVNKELEEGVFQAEETTQTEAELKRRNMALLNARKYFRGTGAQNDT